MASVTTAGEGGKLLTLATADERRGAGERCCDRGTDGVMAAGGDDGEASLLRRYQSVANEKGQMGNIQVVKLFFDLGSTSAARSYNRLDLTV